ncbi:Polynucleotide 5'-hydroxyl-kinase NOL9 [Eumeta japonica]|uniref:Polynucleotide 5'-hydroxyl-kinase NOL9 n=1 Tax=Eumeta variegata TaxID=151549 RepID=A0A4C1WVR0_EUMVA|nr:Polynucleotide 5'-hydroxyl-kinase NOL9 [Eumeta japonica]
MEFFEKAHHSQGLSNKNKLEHKKKQLKRMLDGHKKQNISIIKNSEYVILDQDFDLSSELETTIDEEIEDSKTTSILSMNSVSSSDNSEIEKCNYVRVKRLKSKSKSHHNATDSRSFEMSVDGRMCKNESDLKVQVKKHGKVVLNEKNFTNGVHLKNVMEQTGKFRSDSPLFVSFAPNDVSSNLNDVFDDYSTLGSEYFSLKCTLSADSTLDTDTELFSSKRLKKSKVKCIEVEDFDINKSYDEDSPARGIICGGKGAGKSTFLKYFVNKQLSYGPVLVIDLDPGQCEFTVAGNVSATVVKTPIIGPNYTHLQTPDRAPLKSLYIGLNTKVCETFIDKLLNGKIIALCQYLPKSVKKIFTLTNEPLICVGYGLVRGIDTDSGLMYVLTPITQLQLSQVTCVVYNDWTPEIPSDEKTLASSTLIPYRAEPLCSQPELMQTPRRRFNPLQLLRLAKSS